MREAGRRLEREVQAARGDLAALHPPASARSLQSRSTARALNARLQGLLAKLQQRLHASLAAKPFDSARLGDAVRDVTPADRVVTDINTIP